MTFTWAARAEVPQGRYRVQVRPGFPEEADGDQARLREQLDVHYLGTAPTDAPDRLDAHDDRSEYLDDLPGDAGGLLPRVMDKDGRVGDSAKITVTVTAPAS